jgi:hypothetical protein
MYDQVEDRARDWSLFTCGKILTQCFGERKEMRKKELQHSLSDDTDENLEPSNTKGQIITMPPSFGSERMIIFVWLFPIL